MRPLRAKPSSTRITILLVVGTRQANEYSDETAKREVRRRGKLLKPAGSGHAMKFEPSRVLETVQALGGPQFRGPDALARVAHYATEVFREMTWTVNRRDVQPAGIVRFGGWQWPRRSRIPAIMARMHSPSSAPARVAFHAPLDSDWNSTRPGLAFLLELARSWPASRSQTVEIVCLASPGRRLRSLTFEDSLQGVTRPCDTKPTLTIWLQSPGIGRQLEIIGRPDATLALAAARDLWIPHRLGRSGFVFSRWLPGPLPEGILNSIALIGESGGGEQPALDSGALDRTAQLCGEIALRWARRQAYEVKPAERADRTTARSDQNPG
jgi:hypothetical protein